MITAGQLVAHAVGDYVIQSDWMAQNKTERWLPALIHAVAYGVAFLPLDPSLVAWLVIVGTHAVIDRYRLARFLVWARNLAAPRSEWRPWSECSATGFAPDRPAWLAVWLLIIADNVCHVLINAAALRWL